MTKTVLIVEDNLLNTKLFEDLLAHDGYRTLTARDGMEGLRMARDHSPDLLVLDFFLPELSGADVARMLKSDEVLKGIPIIATTAFAFEGDATMFRDLGCEGYLRKPIDSRQFLALVAKLLG